MGMSREEAINIMSQMIKDEEGFLSDTTVEAHKMAIKALEQEPTTRNCFGCKYSKDNHNAGTEECHLCMWENQYTPTTKNDLGVDCISRAQAQTEIEMNASRYTIAKERGGMGQVEWSDQLIKVSDAVDIIRHLPSVTPQEPRWVPVSEKVPEESGMYLVSGRWENGPYEVWICEFMYLGELRGWANDAKRPIVTAWMPLPEPYKAETEAEDGNDD